jgi:nucleotide-binding universal stress UspA family protein
MFKKILFCTDFSENADWAFTYALALAKTFQAKLLFLHVTPQPVHPEQLTIYLSEEKLEEIKISQKKDLDLNLTTRYLHKMDDFKDFQINVIEGEPFLEILQRANKESVDLIVMGTHGRTGLDHVLFGSTAERVVRKAPCPVLTIRLPGKQFVMP